VSNNTEHCNVPTSAHRISLFKGVASDVTVGGRSTAVSAC